MLKAFLTYHNVPFPKTHVLEILKEKCAEIDEDFADLDFKNLTVYAVEVRYPDSFYVPEVEEALESAEIADQIKKFVFEKLGLDEKEILKWFNERNNE